MGHAILTLKENEMAKFTFYLDIFDAKYQEKTGFMAHTHPPKKMDGNKRWAFDVTIPDDVIHEVDAHAPEVSRPRLVGDDA